MKIAMFDTHRYDRESFEAANRDFGHDITFHDARLTAETVALARGHDVVCPFVNDRVDAEVLAALRQGGVRLVALRSAGYNHVDLAAAARLDLPVVRVPEYSPHAVAEHAVALVLALNRKIHRAYARVGIVGTGRIGRAAARIFRGFGCRLLAFDAHPDAAFAEELGLRYVDAAELYREAHIVSLHVPLTPATHHMLDERALATMRPGAILVNTGRGALIDSRALIGVLKSGRLGAAGLDVYEEEEGVFFQDLSNRVLQDDVLARLLTFPNVLVSAHQGFLTHEALAAIAEVTLGNVAALERGEPLRNQVRLADVLGPSA
jgi:D-lactate dehydrogenase